MESARVRILLSALIYPRGVTGGTLRFERKSSGSNPARPTETPCSIRLGDDLDSKSTSLQLRWRLAEWPCRESQRPGRRRYFQSVNNPTASALLDGHIGSRR